VPRGFWKLLARIEGGELRCTAFLADQGELLDAALRAVGTESFDDLGEVTIFQTRVSNLAEQLAWTSEILSRATPQPSRRRRSN
jgi:hypothetical protein